MPMKINLANLERRDLHELFVSAVVPRPIAFVSSIGNDGVFNLAPFSFFNPLCLKPAVISLSIGWKRDGRKKDTLRNIEYSKDFVVNVVTETLAEAMNESSAEYPSEVDEFQEVGLTPGKADVVNAPLVVESPVNMECKLIQTLEFGEIPTGSTVVIGEIVLVHIRDDLWIKDHIEISKLKAVGRLGGNLYCRITDLFEMKRPE
jgi:flavin reductase (DIM6/NTAB) family NADH-FMN oxidoreductase RutF